MKKFKISVVALIAAGGSLLFTNCIGSFALTKNVMDWNNGVGNKFVNELVFVAFWILPVYEVTALSDLLVLNSIEFWKGENPLTASIQVIDTEQGRYIVNSDATGYTIKHEKSGIETRLEFDTNAQTWWVDIDGTLYPFMTYIDKNHVKMITPNGDMKLFELSEQGVMAYSQEAGIGEKLLAFN